LLRRIKIKWTSVTVTEAELEDVRLCLIQEANKKSETTNIAVE